MLVFAFLACVFAIVGLIFDWYGIREDDKYRPSAEPGVTRPQSSGAPAPNGGTAQGESGPVQWLLSSQETPMYTVEVGAAGSGPVRVLEDDTAEGTYDWADSTLSISFERTLTMEDGFTFQDPWTFVCTGSPEDPVLSCIGTAQRWSYGPQDGLDPGERSDFDATATRR